MAKAQDIINLLQYNIVNYTNLFSKTVQITSLTGSNTTATAVCASPHGYNTGDYIYIAGAQAPVAVTSITLSGGVATVTTSTPHDLTLNPNESFIPVVSIYGANQTQYNGINLPILSVASRNIFTYQVNGSPVSPATGTLYAFDGKERGYNGIHQITVINPTTFTYTVPAALLPAQGTIYAHSNIRITGAADDERAIQSYTKQNTNDLYAYVILDGTDVSKDRNALNDSQGEWIIGNEFRQVIIQNFHILVFKSTIQEIAARSARDMMEDIFTYLCKSLLRAKIDNGFVNEQQFGIITLGHKTFQYDLAYYVHQFDFQLLSLITYDDTIAPDINVAFRDISLVINNSPNETVTTEIKLDV